MTRGMHTVNDQQQHEEKRKGPRGWLVNLFLESINFSAFPSWQRAMSSAPLAVRKVCPLGVICVSCYSNTDEGRDEGMLLRREALLQHRKRTLELIYQSLPSSGSSLSQYNKSDIEQMNPSASIDFIRSIDGIIFDEIKVRYATLRHKNPISMKGSDAVLIGEILTEIIGATSNLLLKRTATSLKTFIRSIYLKSFSSKIKEHRINQLEQLALIGEERHDDDDNNDDDDEVNVDADVVNNTKNSNNDIPFGDHDNTGFGYDDIPNDESAPGDDDGDDDDLQDKDYVVNEQSSNASSDSEHELFNDHSTNEESETDEIIPTTYTVPTSFPYDELVPADNYPELEPQLQAKKSTKDKVSRGVAAAINTLYTQQKFTEEQGIIMVGMMKMVSNAIQIENGSTDIKKLKVGTRVLRGIRTSLPAPIITKIVCSNPECKIQLKSDTEDLDLLCPNCKTPLSTRAGVPLETISRIPAYCWLKLFFKSPDFRENLEIRCYDTCIRGKTSCINCLCL
jgi:hypothetical protein